jgi:hypothetical protein
LLDSAAIENNAAMPTDPPKAEPPKRMRRRLQFSLRTLFVVTTVMAVVCGYVAHVRSMVRMALSAL